MSWFQLDPESIAARARMNESVAPSLRASLARGIIGFAIISVAGFVPWAVFGLWFRSHLGEAALYTACALIFIGLSGPLLHRLIIGPGSLTRFWKIFGISFAGYSIAWIIGWMVLRGHPGSIAGLLAGTVVMGSILVTAFEAKGRLVHVCASLFVLNALGYFLGGEIEGKLIHYQPLAAKLQWGLCYGIGFGAGLGLAFYLCQSRARTLLAKG